MTAVFHQKSNYTLCVFLFRPDAIYNRVFKLMVNYLNTFVVVKSGKQPSLKNIYIYVFRNYEYENMDQEQLLFYFF